MPDESRVEEPVTMRGVRIIFRNFRGEKSPFNQEGARNFGVILPNEELAGVMVKDGWNVKWLEPRDDDEDEVRVPWLQVKVAYDKGRPPKIFLITSRGRTLLNENTVDVLDGSDITNVDLIVTPFNWDVNGKQGVAAYCKSMYVTIEEDELEREYAQMDAQ